MTPLSSTGRGAHICLRGHSKTFVRVRVRHGGLKTNLNGTGTEILSVPRQTLVRDPGRRFGAAQVPRLWIVSFTISPPLDLLHELCEDSLATAMPNHSRSPSRSSFFAAVSSLNSAFSAITWPPV